MRRNQSEYGVPGGRNRTSRRGFTLIELLVALTIVSFALLAVYPLLLGAMDVNSSMRLGVLAKDSATIKVEELMSLPYEVIDDTYLKGGTTYTSPVEYLTRKGAVTTGMDSEGIFRRTFRIDQVPGVTFDPKPVVITSVVQYTYKGKSRSRSFCTMWSF